MTHWLTQYDENGDPEGVLCRCPIDADHLPDGKVFPEEEQMQPMETGPDRIRRAIREDRGGANAPQIPQGFA